MIVDKIKNISLYTNLSERIAKGLNVLNSPDLLNKPDGKYEVDGENIFYLVQRYKTKKISEAQFEAHRKYIDIQAVLKGKETIGYSNINELKEKAPYKEDIIFFETPGNFFEIKLTEGMFSLLYPEDGHMPACNFEGQNEILKVVVKIKI